MLIFQLLQVIVGDFAASRRHVKGVVKIVELNGGPQALGLNGLLKHVLDKLVHDRRLSATSHEKPGAPNNGGAMD
jgi:hypothetical protein